MKSAPFKDEITFEDFAKLDIPVGMIVDVSEVAKSVKHSPLSDLYTLLD